MNQKYYRTEALEAIARQILTKENAGYLNAQPQAVKLEHLIEDVYGLTIRYKYIANNGRILGKTIFDDGYTPYYDMDEHRYDLLAVKKGTMIIDATLLEREQYGRLRFTQAHELSHWIIHQEIYAGTGEAAAFQSSDQDTATEWQANVLATALLMPLGQVKRCFHNCRSKGMSASDILRYMSETFEVSRSAIRIRLQSRGLI